MRGSPGPPSGMRGGPGPNFANINNIHQCEIHMKPRKRKNFLQAWLNKFPSRAKKIDVLARVIFPAIFAFFNMSYWTFYLTQEANTDVKWTLKATILYETSACSIRKCGFTLELILRPTMHKMHCRCLSSTDVWSKEELEQGGPLAGPRADVDVSTEVNVTGFVQCSDIWRVFHESIYFWDKLKFILALFANGKLFRMEIFLLNTYSTFI